MEKKMMAILIIFLTIFSLSTIVFADDDHKDHDEDDEKYKYFQKFDEGEDDDDDRNSSRQNPLMINQQNDYWNIWSRETRNNPDKPLPLSTPAEVTVITDHKETTLYLIPQDGQLLVSGERIAEALEADYQYYEQSKICLLTKPNRELIVRAGFNASYENRVKTPLPTPARSIEKTVYLPVSVAANALGYRVSWDEQKQSLVFQAF